MPQNLPTPARQHSNGWNLLEAPLLKGCESNAGKKKAGQVGPR